MKIEDISQKYPVLERAIKIIKEDGIDELFPPQKMAIEAGVLDGKNVLLCCNTGSGKTMIAELAALNTWMTTNRRKTVYVVPLRALAMEKYEDFKKYEPLGLKVGLSIGDYDSADEWLKTCDVIVCTFEKLDSLFRHRTPWIQEIGLAVLDEIHEIGSDRGPTLEMVTLWLKSYGVQFLGLSATIGNADEIAQWLGAELVESDFRPVPLYEGTYWNGLIEFTEKDTQSVTGGELKLVEDELKKEKQALVFVNTRREAESLARNAKDLCVKYSDKEKLAKLADKVLHSLSSPTEQCKKVAECVSHGCSFHHAGLVNKQRKLIEDAYKAGLIKFIAATVTLVAGVNLPAHRIIIRNIRRYNEDWPVSTYKQAVGRAGRIRFDKEGEAVVLCRSPNEKEFVINSYILGEPEDAISKLGAEPILRMHVLGAISNERFTREQLKWFFFGSFYAHHYQDNIGLGQRLDKVVDQLIRWEMVEETGLKHADSTKTSYLVPTPLGKRVSELYIDPVTGYFFMQELKKLTGTENQRNHTFGLLQLVSMASENYPHPSLRQREIELIQDVLDTNINQMISPAPLPWDPEYEEYVRAAKLASILQDWIQEKSEDFILSTYNIAPGNLRTRVEIAKWLTYAGHEIADIMGHKNVKGEFNVLERRIKHGCKDELLQLVLLKGIGRVRARKLWNFGIKNKQDVINNKNTAIKLVGERVINKAVS